MKAITTPLLIVVVAIILLVTAIVILAVFTGGMQNVVSIINSWFGGGDPCVVGCKSWQATCKPGQTIELRQLPGCDREGSCVCPVRPLQT